MTILNSNIYRTLLSSQHGSNDELFQCAPGAITAQARINDPENDQTTSSNIIPSIQRNNIIGRRGRSFPTISPLGQSHLFVDRIELPFPGVIVKERTMVETIVIGTVGFRVTGRCQYGHLVAVYRVTTIEMFHLVGDL